jgi:hypothetical protein
VSDAAAGRLARLQAFFEERGVARPCPACGHDTWRLLDDDGADRYKKHYAIVRIQPDAPRPLSANDLMFTDVLICRNCGFVRMHAESVVDGAPT